MVQDIVHELEAIIRKLLMPLYFLVPSSHYITIQRIWTEYQCLELVSRMAL